MLTIGPVAARTGHYEEVGVLPERGRDCASADVCGVFPDPALIPPKV